MEEEMGLEIEPGKVAAKQVKVSEAEVKRFEVKLVQIDRFGRLM